MIDLYLAIEEKLSEVPELKYIDMVDQTNPDAGEQDSSEPTALITLPPIEWQQTGDSLMYADINFTIRLSAKPFHRSEGKSPKLAELKNALAWMYAAKDKLYEDGVNFISNICLTNEHFTKQGHTYELLLSYKGFVEYTIE